METYHPLCARERKRLGRMGQSSCVLVLHQRKGLRVNTSNPKLLAKGTLECYDFDRGA